MIVTITKNYNGKIIERVTVSRELTLSGIGRWLPQGGWGWMGESKIMSFRAVGIWEREEGEWSGSGN